MSEFGVETFGSVDEAVAAMRERERTANAGLTDAQRAVDWGDYFVRLVDMPDPVAIFGRIPTLDAILAREQELGAEDDEIAYERESLTDAHRRGYRFGECFSVIEPEGEWGSTHVSNMIGAISAEAFEAAREVGWDVQRWARWLADPENDRPR